MARRGKLTPEIQREICQVIAAGNYIKVAAEYVGLPPQRIFDWMKKGENAKSGRYREFYDAVKKAQKQAEIRNVAIIQEAAQKQWQAAAWYLERKHPERWGRVRVDVNHTGEVQITHKLSDEERAKRLQFLLKQRGNGYFGNNGNIEKALPEGIGGD